MQILNPPFGSSITFWLHTTNYFVIFLNRGVANYQKNYKCLKPKSQKTVLNLDFFQNYNIHTVMQGSKKRRSNFEMFSLLNKQLKLMKWTS